MTDTLKQYEWGDLKIQNERNKARLIMLEIEMSLDEWKKTDHQERSYQLVKDISRLLVHWFESAHSL